MTHLNVFKKTLTNGLNVLVMPQFHVPKVSLQLWYNVGSKNESSGQKGIAHLIEHMIFKGTTTLSESDINLITHKLAGSCNAFTSHDYTGYLFDLPVQHWRYALPIMADCMVNCTFKENLLNSELKAVIQELKMYNDDYASTLLEKMMGSIFYDHPYRYPVIGYKSDLCAVNRDSLITFYRKHYIPNNAHFVVVGAVNPEEVFQATSDAFGNIEPDNSYQPECFHHSIDTVRQSVTLYRDIQQPQAMIAWQIPGARSKMDYIFDAAAWLIANGKASRLYKKLIDELDLVTSVECFVYDLIEHGLFVIGFQPKDSSLMPAIIEIINEQLQDLTSGTFSDEEFKRAVNKTAMDFIVATEDQSRCAYLLGKYFLAHGDEYYLQNYNNYPQELLRNEIVDFVAAYLRPHAIHTGMILPLPEREKDFWIKTQMESDRTDELILSRIVRNQEVEEGKHVNVIKVKPWEPFVYPKGHKITLANGLTVIYYENPNTSKIDIVLELKSKGYYDSLKKPGLFTFLMDCMLEGTNQYSSSAFNQKLESLGMSLNATSGTITMSMLGKDFAQGLSLLNQVLTSATFSSQSIQKIRSQILVDIADFWDSPGQFVGQLARGAVYQDHPYHKSYLGTTEGVKAVSKTDLMQAYERFVTPQEAIMVIVGDLAQYDIKQLIQEYLGNWSGPAVEDLNFPQILKTQRQDIIHPINRDQVVLAFAGLSISRLNPDFDKILLFDQILTGGVLGSMSSRLFEIREKTGLFYTIGGSLLTGAHMQPGMSFIKTVISHDNVENAERMIETVLKRRAEGITQEELESARQAIVSALIENFSTNQTIASSLLFLERFQLPESYFDLRSETLSALSCDDIGVAVDRLLNPENMVRIKIGRVKA